MIPIPPGSFRPSPEPGGRDPRDAAPAGGAPGPESGRVAGPWLDSAPPERARPLLLRALDVVAVAGIGAASLGFWLVLLVLLFTEWETAWLLWATGAALAAAFLAAAAGGRIRDWLCR